MYLTEVVKQRATQPQRNHNATTTQPQHNHNTTLTYNVLTSMFEGPTATT